MTNISHAITAGADVTAAIKQANRNFMQAFQDKDIARASTLYSARARLLPPGGEFVEGITEIMKFWEGAETCFSDVYLETVSVELSGDIALEVGRYTLIADAEIADRGKYLVVWRRENGEWKLYQDVWNTSVQHAAGEEDRPFDRAA